MSRLCPNCSDELNEELIRMGLCNHCGQEFVPVFFRRQIPDILKKQFQPGV